jgi:hypothetical protein
MELHAPAILPHMKRSMLLTEQEAGWTAGSVRWGEGVKSNTPRILRFESKGDFLVRGFLHRGFAYSRSIIVVIFVHRGVGLSLFRGRSCAGARSNTQQPASARLSQ